MRPYLAQIRINLRLMGRDRATLFFSFVFPLIFFFIFAQAFRAGDSPGAMMQVITMVLIIGVLGNGFFGAGMRAVQDRETNVLRRFKVAPVGAAPILIASLVSGLVSFVPSAFLFFVFARLIYHTPFPPNLLSVLVFVSIALLAFRAIGMIIAAVVNSAQEGGILTQILYLPMLFLSGATFPITMMPVWVQTIGQFLPATHLYSGMQSIMIGGRSLAATYIPVLALIVTMIVALIVGTKLFRWEKEEKIAPAAKLWILGVLAPFFILGLYQARTKQNIEQAKILARAINRNSSTLYQNAHIFIGNGAVVDRGAVLVRNGKIAQVYSTPPADTKSLNAEVIDLSGKTLMPGLIDMHVHIGAPGGVYADMAKYADPALGRRHLEAYLYCGVTAVRSVGDWLNKSLDLRKEIRSGSYLGAELFVDGPLFTAKGGHPEELIANYPENMRKEAAEQFLRQPQTAAEARSEVDELKHAGVDGIKAVLEAGTSQNRLFQRLGTGIYDAVIERAAQDGLPTSTHTGNAEDVQDAVKAGTGSIEHGSAVDLIGADLLSQLKEKGTAYDPTLSVIEAIVALRAGDTSSLNRSLLQQVGPADLLEATRKQVLKGKRNDMDHQSRMSELAKTNLINAYKAGVTLITGSDAGNMLVVHGPTVQHEMELWVKAGIAPSAALQAATGNAANVLGAGNRIGSIVKGLEANFILLDGDPVQDITVTEHINTVVYQGEHVNRQELFGQ